MMHLGNALSAHSRKCLVTPECWTGVEQLFPWQRRWAILSQQPTIFFCVFSRMTQVGWSGWCSSWPWSSKIPCGAWSLGFIIQSLSCVWLFATPWTAAGASSHPLNSPASLYKYSSYSPHWSFFIVDKSCNWNTGHGDGKRGWGEELCLRWSQ